MTSVSGTGSSGSTNSSGSTSSTDKYSNLKVSDFIQLLVTELTNQDPTSPVDNSTILNEISQIKSIQASQGLSDTLTSVLLGTNLATGSSLIGHSVTAKDDSSNSVTGTVSSVTVSDGTVKLKVGSSTVSLSNVTQIDAGS
jgi:flagellar basal-body rod modification protein FlgD